MNEKFAYVCTIDKCNNCTSTFKYITFLNCVDFVVYIIVDSFVRQWIILKNEQNMYFY